jgi:UDP-glucose 4-epimerase
MSRILVTGGCGYIGSHTIVELIENGFEVISLDNLENSSDNVLDGVYSITGTRVKNYAVDLRDKDALGTFFESQPPFTGIIHFAALKSVNDSVKEPLSYFENNVTGMINLLQFVNVYNIPHFVFSSSCTVYGIPATLPVTEDFPYGEVESPYGRTKQICEMILQDFIPAHPKTKVISLRYFNPAGAHPSIMIGEDPANVAQNLAPVITETAIGKRDKMIVFGDDYDTRDGSCVRDYIHVSDLANAHILCLRHLENTPNAPAWDTFNVGIGQGVTVLEAIEAFENVTGQKLNYSIGPRREGDIPAIYSNYTKAKSMLGWEPKLGIKEIMDTAWKWEQKRNG